MIDKLSGNAFGDAGTTVVIEEGLDGEVDLTDWNAPDSGRDSEREPWIEFDLETLGLTLDGGKAPGGGNAKDEAAGGGAR